MRNLGSIEHLLTRNGDSLAFDNSGRLWIGSGRNGFVDGPLLYPLPDIGHPFHRDILKCVDDPRDLQ